MSWSAARPTSTALDRLELGMKYRLVLIVAPQGLGKTRLLHEWMGERSKNYSPAPIWVTLEQPDNDIETFLQHLTSAVAQSEPALENQLKQVSKEKGTINTEEVLIELINRLAEQPQEIALILDEYHSITSGVVHQAVSFFIDYLPPKVHLYLAARGEPPFHVAHLRARREMIEIGPAELSTRPE